MSVSPKCPDGEHVPTTIDPTGGNPFMGGPVRIVICSQCGWELPPEIRPTPPAGCCVPGDGEEHCDHHPEWHDKRGCNHPDCRVTSPAAGHTS